MMRKAQEVGVGVPIEMEVVEVLVEDLHYHPEVEWEGAPWDLCHLLQVEIGCKELALATVRKKV